MAGIVQSEDLDLGPTLSNLKVNGKRTSGTITGSAYRMDILDFTPPAHIVTKIVGIEFEFMASEEAVPNCDTPSDGQPQACSREGLVQACSRNGCSVSGTTCSNPGQSASITIPRNLTSFESCRNIAEFIAEWCQ